MKICNYVAKLPFGEDLATPQRTIQLGYIADTTRQKFTGYEKDTESGLDFAQARMYGGSYGRFTSPDPLLSSSKTSRPQTWNRYTYVLNNPLAFVDPSGLRPVYSWFDKKHNTTWFSYKKQPGYTRYRGGDQIFIYNDRWYNVTSKEITDLGKVESTSNVETNSNNQYEAPSVSPGQSDQSGIFSLLFEFVSGTGQTNRQFGPGTYMTEGMRKSPEVTDQRRMFCAQGACQQFVNYRGGRRFGLFGGRYDQPSQDGAVRAAVEQGIFAPRSFVGSFGIEITGPSSDDQDTRFEITNDKQLNKSYVVF